MELIFLRDFSAVVTLINSEMTSIFSEEDTDAKGSVIVVHIAGDTGELLRAEEYVAHDVAVGTHYTTEAGNFTNIGYEFNRMGYLSAPAPKVMNYRRPAPVPPRMRTQARPSQRAQAKVTLPQTGDSETSALTALGMVSLGLAGFAVTGLKKRF